MKKRIVQVKQVQLHMTHRHLPPEDSSSTAFFFLRTTLDPVPSPSSPEDATASLALCFEMGTVDSGRPLQALSKTLSHLYIPMLMIAGIYTNTRIYLCYFQLVCVWYKLHAYNNHE